MTEKNYYEQTDAQFKIRLPHELKEKIRASAEEHNRTMTADIVARLEQTFVNEEKERAFMKEFANLTVEYKMLGEMVQAYREQLDRLSDIGKELEQSLTKSSD